MICILIVWFLMCYNKLRLENNNWIYLLELELLKVDIFFILKL